jgi:DUF4097 and DUF4098 domain-containing protein YvlB
MSHGLRALGFAAVLAISLPASADCDRRADKSADIDASGANKLVIDVGAGDLVVTGSASTPQVRARGEACADSQKLLDAIRIDTRRDGSTLFLTTVMPEGRSIMQQASLDLTIELPAGLAVEIDDSSGDIEVRKVAAVKISDSSGDQSIRDVEGDVSVADSSGDIRIQTVRGNVAVRDSSGDIRVTDITGNVTIPVDSSGGMSLQRIRGDVHILTDSSGDIVIADVNQNVQIDNDSSGDIRANDIGGNLTVAHDTTGDISHRNVLGKVDIPN